MRLTEVALWATPHVRLSRQRTRPVHARLATKDESERLWQCWLEIEPDDAFARQRSVETPVALLEPRDTTV